MLICFCSVKSKKIKKWKGKYLGVKFDLKWPFFSHSLCHITSCIGLKCESKSPFQVSCRLYEQKPFKSKTFWNEHKLECNLHVLYINNCVYVSLTLAPHSSTKGLWAKHMLGSVAIHGYNFLLFIMWKLLG